MHRSRSKSPGSGPPLRVYAGLEEIKQSLTALAISTSEVGPKPGMGVFLPCTAPHSV